MKLVETIGNVEIFQDDGLPGLPRFRLMQNKQQVGKRTNGGYLAFELAREIAQQLSGTAITNPLWNDWSEIIGETK